MNARQFRRLVDTSFREQGLPRLAGEWIVKHESLTWFVELFRANPGLEPSFGFVVGAWVPEVDPSEPVRATDCAFTFRPQSEPWTGPRILPATTPMVTASGLVLPLPFSLEYDITDAVRARAVSGYVDRLVGHLRSVSDLASLARAHGEGMRPTVVLKSMRSALESAA